MIYRTSKAAMKLKHTFVGLLMFGCFVFVGVIVFIVRTNIIKRSLRGSVICEIQNGPDNTGNLKLTLQRNCSQYERHKGRNMTRNYDIPKKHELLNPIFIRKISTDATKIKDYHRWPFIIPNTEKCRGNVSFVVLVNSGVDYHARRTALRNTWADQKLFDKHEMRVVFLLGKTEKSTTQDRILKEQLTFGDIVQGSFVDNYYNLTYKGMLGFRWVLEHCFNAKRVVKVDDDVHLDVFQLMKMLSTDIEMRTSNKSVWCEKMGPSLPIYRQGRWKLDASQFPGMKTYPLPICKGLLVILPTIRLQDLYVVASDVDFIHMDDVLLFSVVPYMVGLEIRPINKYILGNGQMVIECSQKKNTNFCRTDYMAVMMRASDGNAKVTDFWSRSVTEMMKKIWLLSLKTSYSSVITFGNTPYISTKVKHVEKSLQHDAS